MRLPHVLTLWSRLKGLRSRQQWPVHPFDLKYGVETSKARPFWRPKSGNRLLDQGNVGYVGSQPSVIRQALEKIEHLEHATFIDVGCGKGRALIVATEYPFAKVVGCEMLEDLCVVARKNAATLKSTFPTRTPIDIVVGDATKLKPSIYGLHNIIFLYNPFSLDVTQDFLVSIELDIQAHPEMKLFIVYYNPVDANLFDRSPHLTRMMAEHFQVTPEDMSGSVFGNAHDSVVIYQNMAQPTQRAFAGADREVLVTVPRFEAVVQP